MSIKSNEYEKESKSQSRHTNIEVNIIITHVNIIGHIKIALHSDLYLLVWYHAGNFSSKHSTQGERENERERERKLHEKIRRYKTNKSSLKLTKNSHLNPFLLFSGW